MKTRSQYQCEQLPIVGGYFVTTRRSLYRPTRVKEDSSQPPLHDPFHKDQTMEEPPLQDQPDHEDDDASSSVSTVEELSFESDHTETESESDDAESDDECIGQGTSSSVNDVIPTPAPAPAPAPFTGSSCHTEDYSSVDEATEKPGRAKPTGDEWKMSWPKEGMKTESAGINVYGFYRKRTGCGGYAVLLRNLSAQPIAAIANVSPDGKSHTFQVFAGLAAGLRLAARHGCSRPRIRCNSSFAVDYFRRVAPCRCQCGGSRIGNICYKHVCSFYPGLSNDCFETLVPLINELLGRELSPYDFYNTSRMSNNPAHYLAKQAKKKALLDRKLLDQEVSIKPDEFPDELVSFLLDDAYDCNYFY